VFFFYYCVAVPNKTAVLFLFYLSGFDASLNGDNLKTTLVLMAYTLGPVASRLADGTRKMVRHLNKKNYERVTR
jgi:hypothetical protein